MGTRRGCGDLMDIDEAGEWAGEWGCVEREEKYM